MEELANLIENRIAMYSLLGHIYRREVSDAFFAGLKSMTFPTEGDNEMLNDGFRQLTSFLKSPGDDPINDLAVDYARVFLGAGIAEGTVAYPYESVYTSPEGLIKQEAWEQVFNIFRAHGLSKIDTDIEEDHIALELQFMRFLNEKAMEALNANDNGAVNANLREQKEFLHKHLLNWTPKFLKDLNDCVSSDFYKAVAKITEGYLAIEAPLLDELTAQ